MNNIFLQMHHHALFVFSNVVPLQFRMTNYNLHPVKVLICMCKLISTCNAMGFIFQKLRLSNFFPFFFFCVKIYTYVHFFSPVSWETRWCLHSKFKEWLVHYSICSFKSSNNSTKIIQSVNHENAEFSKFALAHFAIIMSNTTYEYRSGRTLLQSQHTTHQ